MPARTRVSPEFGSTLKESMGRLSQSEVALRARVSVGYINRMTRGSVPSRDIILQVAEALETDPNPMLLAAGYESEQAQGSSPDHDDQELGHHAAAQLLRQLWDQSVAPLFPDAVMPSGADLPRTRAGIRSRVRRWVKDLAQDSE